MVAVQGGFILNRRAPGFLGAHAGLGDIGKTPEVRCQHVNRRAVHA